MTRSAQEYPFYFALVGCLATSVGIPADTRGETSHELGGSIRMTEEKPSPVKRATAAGVTFEWSIVGNTLRGRMSAPTRGWVTVGFNRSRDLKGTRLIMGYVRDGKTVVEEHIADPPDHRPKIALGGSNGVLAASGWEDAAGTTIEFTLQLSTGDRFDVPLVAGQGYYTTFAWSHEDDLYHHSAMRTAIDLTL